MEEKKAQTIKTYNATAQAMKQKFEGIGVRAEDVARAFSFISKMHPKVLEIGCGHGREAVEILKHTNDYLGIDIAEGFIAVARKDVPNGTFMVADIDTYTFPPSLDIIFAFASLLHSTRESVERILRVAATALNEGGIFYISLKKGEYKEVTKEDEFGVRTYYFYTPEDIKLLAGDVYETIYEDIQYIRGQDWFTICLKKK